METSSDKRDQVHVSWSADVKTSALPPKGQALRLTLAVDTAGAPPQPPRTVMKRATPDREGSSPSQDATDCGRKRSKKNGPSDTTTKSRRRRKTVAVEDGLSNLAESSLRPLHEE